MSRYPPIPPAQLTPEQQPVFDKTTAICDALFGIPFLYKDSNGAFVGPFAPGMYTPTLLPPYIQIGAELGKFKEISPAVRETAILATGSVFKAAFELSAHGKLALLKNILSERQIECITQGTKPNGDEKLSNDCEIAFDIAIELATGKGPLSDESFSRLTGAFGKVGALALIHYVGIYSYTCILLNGVASPAITY